MNSSSLRAGKAHTAPRVCRFEKEFASAVDASRAVAVKSGIATLHSAREAAPFSCEARLFGVGILRNCIAALVWATLSLTSRRRVDLILRLPLALAILPLLYGAGFLTDLVRFGDCWGEVFSPAAARREPG